MSGLRQRRAALQLERAELRLRSAAQRRELLLQGEPLQQGLAMADHAAAELRQAARWVRAHPGLTVAGAAMALWLLRPGRVLAWSGRVITLWSLWQRLAPRLVGRPPH